MVRGMTLARLLVAALMLAAVIHDLLAAIDRGTFVVWNFFGYFTIQTNLIGIVTLVIASRFTGRARPRWVEYLRASAATYLVIVVTVFWTLLAPTSDGLWTWTNLVLHGVSGVVLLADWLTEGPRTRLPVRNVWIVILYPVAWAIVVLIRGATDGWFPYPFLDPANSYASIAVVVAGIFVAGLVVGALMFSATRWRRITPAAV